MVFVIKQSIQLVNLWVFPVFGHPYPVVLRPFHAIVTERCRREVSNQNCGPKKAHRAWTEAGTSPMAEEAEDWREARSAPCLSNPFAQSYLPPKMEGFPSGMHIERVPSP